MEERKNMSKERGEKGQEYKGRRSEVMGEYRISEDGGKKRKKKTMSNDD